MLFTGTFHHVGLACRSIEDEAANMAAIGYAAEGAPITDPIQKVRVQFFAGAGPRVELIEPAAPDSPVTGILKRGTKFYHLAYEVEDLEGTIKLLDTHAFRPIGAAAPAVAFAMRRIIFLMARSGTLIELIEMKSAG